MRYPAFLPSRPILISLLAASFLSACASKQGPVRSMGEQTQKLSAVAHPMLAGAADSCIAKAMRQQLIMAMRFDAQASEQAARQRCAMEEKMSPRLVALNEILLAYGKLLVDTADGKLPSYKEQYKGLGDALAGLAQPGSGAPLLDASQLSVVMKLAQYMNTLATQRMQKASLRELLAHQEAITIVSNALKEYALRVHLPNLREEAREVDQLRGAVGAMSAAEPLAANYVGSHLYQERKLLARRQEAATAYAQAVDAMQQSLAGLATSVDSPQDPQWQAQVDAFAQRVAMLERQAALPSPSRW
ncbi:hypothetical protein [Janthinobacterium psychrotolerans]|uniref:Uncharacterized protein n=1 Tax=Janthinobacterium psychrotolerans TaxID=1747903 RepID=A0A1A7C0F0_9BURK|nr:hypothetical protein [Janthinobacterium psychrotolerans]OBV38205.1 hypothetical protein ASR47_1005159 [Janthinobacterium psychrotolerans]